MEPLRWALALRPTFIACEQVPPVLPLWGNFAEALERTGYTTWTGVLSAEQFGVPQARKRAILIASLAGRVSPPAPTHQRYIAPPKESDDPALFDAGDRGRIIARGEEHLLPWVSMAEALGWGMTERPTVTVAAGSGRQGGHDPLDGGSGARATVEREREREARGLRAFRLHRGAGMNERHGDRPDTPETEPAPTITSKARTARWYDRRQGNTRPGGAREMVRLVPDTDPAPTIGAAGLATGRDVWVYARPSTAVCADPRVSPPGFRGKPGDYDADGNYTGERSMDNAVRVSIDEAAILQSFPPDYPWQGSRTKQFEQIGNAVPPLLARAIIAALVGEQRKAA